MQKQKQEQPKTELTKTKKRKPSVLMRIPLTWYEQIKEQSWERRVKMVDLMNEILRKSSVLKTPTKATK